MKKMLFSLVLGIMALSSVTYAAITAEQATDPNIVGQSVAVITNRTSQGEPIAQVCKVAKKGIGFPFHAKKYVLLKDCTYAGTYQKETGDIGRSPLVASDELFLGKECLDQQCTVKLGDVLPGPTEKNIYCHNDCDEGGKVIFIFSGELDGYIVRYGSSMPITHDGFIVDYFRYTITTNLKK